MYWEIRPHGTWHITVIFEIRIQLWLCAILYHHYAEAWLNYEKTFVSPPYIVTSMIKMKDWKNVYYHKKNIGRCSFSNTYINCVLSNDNVKFFNENTIRFFFPIFISFDYYSVNSDNGSNWLLLSNV